MKSPYMGIGASGQPFPLQSHRRCRGFESAGTAQKPGSRLKAGGVARLKAGGGDPDRSTREPPGMGVLFIDTGCAGTCTHSQGVQAVPYGVIDRREIGYSIVYTTPTHVHYWVSLPPYIITSTPHRDIFMMETSWRCVVVKRIFFYT